MALEDKHRWRHRCSSCSEGTKKKWGCKRPGSDYKQEGQPFRFTSPALVDVIMYECPIGKLLRDAPWVWDAIELAGLSSNASPSEWMRMPQWLKYACRVVSGEESRLREEEKAAKQSLADSRRGMAVRRGRH